MIKQIFNNTWTKGKLRHTLNSRDAQSYAQYNMWSRPIKHQNL